MERQFVFASAPNPELGLAEDCEIRQADADSFEHCFLRSEARSVVCSPISGSSAIGYLVRRENPILGQPRTPREFLLNAAVIDKVNAQTENHNITGKRARCAWTGWSFIIPGPPV